MIDNLTTEVSAFFGDTKYKFQLTAPMIMELERTCETGIGGLFDRVLRSQFKLLETQEVIRLGLIGAGMEPQRAHELVTTYLNSGKPIGAAYPLALEILNALMFGVDPLTVKAAEISPIIHTANHSNVVNEMMKDSA